MPGLPEITLVGTATRDPELRFTATGTAVANVTLAANDRRFDKTTGQWADNGATFLRCTCWREMAENIAESLTQGARVIVTGQLRQREWTDNEGNQRTSFEVDVTEIGASLRWATATVRKPTRTNTTPTTSAAGDPWGSAPPAPAAAAPDTPPF